MSAVIARTAAARIISILRRMRLAAPLLTAILAACETTAPTGNDLPNPGSQPPVQTVTRVDITGSAWLVEQGWGSYSATVVGLGGKVLTDRVPAWGVSDTAIGMVTNGSVYAKRAGEIVLVASAGGKADTLRVVVRPLTVDSIAVSAPGAPVRVGEIGWMGAQTWAADGRTLYDRIVTWTSSDLSVATVEGGKVRGIREGSVDITATSEGRSATRRITVQPSRAAGTWMVRIAELRNANTICTVTGMRVILTQSGDSLTGGIVTGTPSVYCTAIVGTEGPYVTPFAPVGTVTGTIAENGGVVLRLGDRWSINGMLDRGAQVLRGSAYYVDGEPEDMIRPLRIGGATFERP